MLPTELNIGDNTYLKFQAMCPFMSTEHDALIVDGACNRSRSPINKTPALIEWCPFIVYDFGEKLRV